MKLTLISVVTLLTSSGFASQIVFKNMYTEHTIVQGMGKTEDEAKADAQVGIPSGWEADPGNSPNVGCRLTQPGALGPQDETKFSCNPKLAGNEVLYSIPIIPKMDKQERATYLKR